jgi:hypothetical protein
MPGRLQVVAHANPLSYEVHGMRELLLCVSTGGWLWLDFLVVSSFFQTYSRRCPPMSYGMFTVSSAPGFGRQPPENVPSSRQDPLKVASSGP